MDPNMNHSMHDHHNHHNMMMTTTGPMSMNGSMHNHHHNMSHHNMNMSSGGGGTGMSGMDGHNHGDMHNMGGHDMGGMHMDMMKMYFHTGIKEYVLFESCHTDTNRDMIVACVVIFFVAIMYEGLKFMREVLLQQSLQDRARAYYPDTKMSAAGNSQEHMVIRGSNASVAQQMFSSHHAIQTFLHIVQIFISYCLMLVFMTYNAWLCISVVIGAGVGYFIFGWKRAMIVDSNEHCH